MLSVVSVFCYDTGNGGARNGDKGRYFGLRTKKGLSQDELAAKVMVTRQAVSRWENGETVPNTETLKLLSKGFRTGGSESPGIINMER